MYVKLIFLAALFYFLIPGVLIRLPPGGSTMVVNITHAVVFALKSLQNSIMFTPRGPRAWPIAGEGFAPPASTNSRAVPFTDAIYRRRAETVKSRGAGRPARG